MWDIFDKIIYIPGNHDHHIWELARETQYVEHITRHPDKNMDLPWHKTEMFLLEPKEKGGENNLVSSYFLNKVLERHSHIDLARLQDDIDINVAYPNLGILSDSKEKCVVFHHGHFIESKYWILSKLKADLLNMNNDMPGDIQLIESENFAWIDFFWSALGRSGEVGTLTKTLYEHMLDEEHIKIFISKVADNLAKKYDNKFIPEPLKKVFWKTVLELAFRKISEGERGSKDETSGVETEKGINIYLKAVKNQIIDELHGMVPSELVFVFGHTHKPFLKSFNIDGFKMPVAVYNTGGWVVDKVDRMKVFGGGVLLLDEKLDACLLEMYREFDNPDEYQVNVKHLDEGMKESPFYDRISNLVHPGEKPWKQFSNISQLEVESRADRLDKRLRSL
jgi:hypothetical protein